MWPVYKAAGRIAAIGINKACKAAEAKARKLLKTEPAKTVPKPRKGK
jgi:hypothetical protein